MQHITYKYRYIAIDTYEAFSLLMLYVLAMH